MFPGTQGNVEEMAAVALETESKKWHQVLTVNPRQQAHGAEGSGWQTGLGIRTRGAQSLEDPGYCSYKLQPTGSVQVTKKAIL